MEEAGWPDPDSPLTIRVSAEVCADVQDFTSFVIETIAQTGLPYEASRHDCLAQIGYRVKARGVATTFAVTDEDRTRYGAAADAYIRTSFPDLFEGGNELLGRIETSTADIGKHLEDIGDWAGRIGQAPYTPARAKALEGLRERLQKVVDAIMPKPKERKLPWDEAAAEVREDDLGLPARGTRLPPS